MSEPCCSIARAYLQRIGDLEERLERAEAALKHDRGDLEPPPDWGLTPQEAVLARIFARRQASKTAIMSALEQDRPTLDGRAANHVSVLLTRIRTKLADFGFVIPNPRSHRSLYGVHPEQFEAFRAAMMGEGPIAYPAQAPSKQRKRSA